tara:strand:- start:172 stop:369 length:198 start_codon:yes stop_codon:yes gene_type:complete
MTSIFFWTNCTSNYCFVAVVGTYAPLTGATNTSLGSTDDDVLSNSVALPLFICICWYFLFSNKSL